MRRLLAPSLLALLMAGCSSAIRMAGTENTPEAELVELLIPAHHENLRAHWGPALHLKTVRIDGRDLDLSGEDRRVWLLPGKHQIFPSFETCVHWPSSWFKSKSDAPVNADRLPPFESEGGRSYRLRLLVGWNSGPWYSLKFESDSPELLKPAEH